MGFDRNLAKSLRDTSRNTKTTPPPNWEWTTLKSTRTCSMALPAGTNSSSWENCPAGEPIRVSLCGTSTSTSSADRILTRAFTAICGGSTSNFWKTNKPCWITACSRTIASRSWTWSGRKCCSKDRSLRGWPITRESCKSSASSTLFTEAWTIMTQARPCTHLTWRPSLGLQSRPLSKRSRLEAVIQAQEMTLYCGLSRGTQLSKLEWDLWFFLEDTREEWRLMISTFWET